MCKTGLLRSHLADSEGSGDYGPQMLHEASSPAAPPQGTWGCQEWAEHLHTHYAAPATTAMQLKCAAFTSAASNPLYQQEPVPSIHNAGVGYRDMTLAANVDMKKCLQPHAVHQTHTSCYVHSHKELCAHTRSSLCKVRRHTALISCITVRRIMLVCGLE